MWNENELRALIDKWQPIARLADWDIKLEIVTKPWRKTGDVKIDLENKAAILLINGCDPKRDNIEAVIVHELMHVKLWTMDQMIESLLHAVYGDDDSDPKFEFAYTQFMVALESTAEDLAKGFVALGADDKRTTYGRLQREADAEWGKDADRRELEDIAP